MSAYTKTRIIYFPADKTYLYLLDLIKALQKSKNDLNVRLTESKDHSYIKAKIPYGFLDICITSQDEKSLVQLTFNFKKWLHRMYYLTVFLIITVVLLGIGNFRYFGTIFICLLFIIYAQERVKSIESKFMAAFSSFFLGLGAVVEIEDKRKGLTPDEL